METGVDKNIETNKKIATQVPRNLIMNVIFFALNMSVGMALTPFFLTSLGKDAYHFIYLAISFTGYVAIVVLSLNTAVSRFLTVDLQKNDYKSASKTFNTAIIGLSALIVLMIPILIVIGYNISYIFTIPSTVPAKDVSWLILGIFASFLITSWTGNFTVQLFALNRIDLQVIVNATLFLTQNGLTVLFFQLYHPSLVYVGLAYPIGAICASIMSITLSRLVCPHLKISPSQFDFTQLKTLFSMSSWAIVNQIGTLLFIQIDLIVINKLCTSVAGQYTAVLSLVAILRNIAATISGVLVPVVYTYYAKKQTETLVRMVVSAVKIMGIFMALPIGLLCGFSGQILTIWLDSMGKPIGFTPADFAPLLVLMAFHLTINLSVLPLFAINLAYNKIRTPGIVTLVMGIGNFSLAVALPLLIMHGFDRSDIAYYGVAGAGAIVLTLKNAIFTPWYTGRIMGINPTIFLKSMITGVVCTTLIAIVSYAVAKSGIIPITSFATLIPVGAAIGLIYMLLVWKFALDPFERAQFKNVMPPVIWRVMEQI
ncbi:MAG TPA: hypothetical protein VK436_11125 [Methanocella sp.]|nr:hypothetical protein [Methanocella sp.]